MALSPDINSLPLDVVGSSTFGRYPKISACRTYNMFISDGALVPYAGYKIAVPQSVLNNGEGRALFFSVGLQKLIAVIGAEVYLLTINYNQALDVVQSYQVINIGRLNTSKGPVYIAENNKPQIGISDNSGFYIYEAANPIVTQVTTLNFIPGYLSFHDTYFILAASQDATYNPPAFNTWRLSDQNDGNSWPAIDRRIGLLQTKADRVKAVVRMPGKGNNILVMGETVTESWFDTGARLFPYQRNTQFNIDYGCLSPATVASLDSVVVWLGVNESSGPVILATTGSNIQKITTDGIDYFLSTLSNPKDSQAFLFRQDGHLFYHINFYSDNVSLFYDFNTSRFFHATDSYGNYFIASSLAYYNNQYYFVSRNDGNVYALDTTLTTYQEQIGSTVQTRQIPRSRICSNIRFPDQLYTNIVSAAFTIESGQTSYIDQSMPLPLSKPRVDIAVSRDGGATFSSTFGQSLPGIGIGKNKLYFWQLGAANDAVLRFDFWSFGRVVALDGEVNVRK